MDTKVKKSYVVSAFRRTSWRLDLTKRVKKSP